MKKKINHVGKVLSRSSMKSVSGGKFAPEGGCPGTGPYTATYNCRDENGNQTGQQVCCKGVIGGPYQNGVMCEILGGPTIVIFCGTNSN